MPAEVQAAYAFLVDAGFTSRLLTTEGLADRSPMRMLRSIADFGGLARDTMSPAMIIRDRR